MKILGIENRTENWKTAYYFSPFFWDENARLRLAQKLGAPATTQANDVQINPFWTGVRDYFHGNAGSNKNGYKTKAASKHNGQLAVIYKDRFPKLREEIQSFGRFGQLKDINYNTGKRNWEDRLFNNLFSTEFDIVLEVQGYLFVGEAKDEMQLTGRGELFLVHQLIRQYVTAKMLLDFLEFKGEVVPFVIRDSLKGREQAQVEFMIQQCWLKDNNVLKWKDIKELWPKPWPPRT